MDDRYDRPFHYQFRDACGFGPLSIAERREAECVATGVGYVVEFVQPSVVARRSRAMGLPDERR